MAAVQYKCFRLRGIPDRYQTRVDVRELVMSTLSIPPGESVTVHSLATNPIQQTTKIATLSFNNIPDAFSHSSTNEWPIQLPVAMPVEEHECGRPEMIIFDTHFSGFTPLQHTKDQECTTEAGSVIAVTGLGGHAFGSFKSRNSAFMWLRDALPLEFPWARVLIYGYDAHLVKSKSVQNLADLGRTFALQLQGMKMSSGPRSTVFIGHSLGGLVIKEAVVILNRQKNARNVTILHSLSGFLFFGVPHLGLAIGSLVRLVRDQPNRGLLESLNKEGSVYLPILDADFKQAICQGYYPIIAFYETEVSPTAVESHNGRWEFSGPPELLVDFASATHGTERHMQHPINSSHSEMVKFRHHCDDAYLRITLCLRSLLIEPSMSLATGNPVRLTGASSTISDEQQECLRSLAFKEQESRHIEVHTAKNSCGWLLQNTQYQNWTSTACDLLWVKGHPGVGKSVLMKYAVEVMRTSPSHHFVASFFFHGRGTSLQKSPLGMFRSILNSLLLHLPPTSSVLSDLTRLYEEREKRYGSYAEQRWNWEEKELEKFLSKALVEGTESRPVAIFIDALDECGEGSAKDLLLYFKSLIKDVREHSGQVKICFSSRHYPILGLNTIPIISVEQQNDTDIRFFVHDRLREITPTSERQRLETEILLKAHGSFQWVVMVTSQAVDSYARGTKAEVIYEKLKHIPEDLNELYTRILGTVSDDDMAQMIKLFQWVLFAVRPLSAQELREALASDPDMEHATVCSLRRSTANWIENIDNFTTKIRDLSRGLVEFQAREIWERHDPQDEEWWDREAQFIHQSVADFVLKYLLSIDSERGASHFAISRSCLRYMALKEILESVELNRGPLFARFPLLPYATSFLFHHIRQVDLQGIPQPDLLQVICWDKESHPLAALWKVLDPDFRHTPEGWPFVQGSPLHVIVACGAKMEFDSFLERGEGEVDSTDEHGNTPLIIAIREHQQEMATALLDRSFEWRRRHGNMLCEDRGQEIIQHAASWTIDINHENEDGETPLSIALSETNDEMILNLIRTGADVGSGIGSDLILYAVRNKDCDLVSELIKSNVDLGGVIFVAVKESPNIGVDDVFKRIIADMLTAGADTIDRKLSVPRSSRDEMDSETDDDEEAIDMGEDALLLACRRGHLAMVHTLLSCGSSAKSHNNYGMSALHVAAEAGHEDVVRLLIRHQKSAIAERDDWDRIPIDVAIRWDREHIALILLAEISNLPDSVHKYRTSTALLYQAAKSGMTNLVEAILKKARCTPSIINWTDMDGHTALDIALAHQHERIASVLIPVTELSVSGDWRTPLMRAALHLQTSAVDAILQTGKASVCCMDTASMTALCSVLIACLAPNAPWAVGAQDLLAARRALSLVLLDKPPPGLWSRYGSTRADGIPESTIPRMTPLCMAVQYNNEILVRLLLARGVNPDGESRSGYGGQTPLFLALLSGFETIARLLLEKGADPNRRGCRSATALSLRNGTDTMIRLLLDYGAKRD